MLVPLLLTLGIGGLIVAHRTANIEFVRGRKYLITVAAKPPISPALIGPLNLALPNVGAENARIHQGNGETIIHFDAIAPETTVLAKGSLYLNVLGIQTTLVNAVEYG